jgi:hypothetical protein
MLLQDEEEDIWISGELTLPPFLKEKTQTKGWILAS